jgi:hypothetical protein
MPNTDKPSYTYTPLFCEENIWKLIDVLYTNQGLLTKPIDVLFILNQHNSIALFEQKLCAGTNPVIWDYHVVLVAKKATEIVVFDFDSRCRFPQNIADYFCQSFPENISLSETYQPLLKPIKADYFHTHFYSNREHMRGIIDDNEFPEYKIIKPANSIDKLTLDECRKTENTTNTKNTISNELVLPVNYLKLIQNRYK